MTATCGSLPDVGPDLHFYTSTDLPDAAVPEVTFTTVQTDPGRLKPMYRTSTDGSCSFYDFWDSELQTECYFSGDATSGYYCYPDVSGYIVADAFSDAGCSTPVNYVVSPTCLVDKVPKYTATYTVADCSTELFHYHKLSAGVTGAAVSFFTGAPGNCTPLSADPDSTYFTLGPELPSTTFVSGQTMPP